MGTNLNEVDTHQLITLVHRRPVLWDKTQEKYKDKFKTQEAWKDIFIELKDDFEECDDNQKNEFGKVVVKKWTQVRDSYRKSLSKNKMKSGNGASKVKTYIYSSQLRFLDKIFRERATDDTLSQNIEDPGPANELTENDEIKQEPVPGGSNDGGEGATDGLPKDQFKKPAHKKKKLDAFGSEMLAALRETPNRHLYFFKGLLPSLEDFDDFDTLDFQMEVLKVVKNIRLRKHPVPSAAVPCTQSLNSQNQLHPDDAMN